MHNFRIFFFLLFSLLFLASCAPSFTESKTANRPVASTSGQKPLTTAPSLSEVRDNASTLAAPSEGVRTVYEGELGEGNEVRIKMMSGFGRQLELCDANKKCEPVRLYAKIESSSSTSTDQTGDATPEDTVIGDVELSDQTKALLGRRITEAAAGRKILIMPPDVELSLLTAGGLKEPNALWTSAATGYITEFTTQYFTELGHQVTIHSDDAKLVPTETSQDLIDLHEAVGQSIFLYQYSGLFQLPTKRNGGFNWKLGKTARELKEGYGADLGLFVYVRDSYASGSRVAAQFLAAVLLGVSVPGGQQVGFVSLVDLETGDIVWYNRLISGGGDLRTHKAAFDAVENLLEDIPL